MIGLLRIDWVKGVMGVGVGGRSWERFGVISIMIVVERGKEGEG